MHLRLSPIPESIMSAVCQFPDLDSAVLTAQEIIQYGVPIARVELLNKDQMDISIKYSKLENLESLPTLFYEFHGSEISNKESIDVVEEISKNNNGSDFKWAVNIEERNKMWKARHNAYYSVKAQGDDVRVYATDVCVPISNIVECIKFAENELQGTGLKAPMVGTAYVSPEPGKAPFIRLGDTVSNNQPLLIIEAMKVMNTINAPKGGKVVFIGFEDGQPVEFEQLLVIIE